MGVCNTIRSFYPMMLTERAGCKIIDMTMFLCSVTQSCLTVRLRGLYPQGCSVRGDSPGRNTGGGASLWSGG